MTNGSRKTDLLFGHLETKRRITSCSRSFHILLSILLSFKLVQNELRGRETFAKSYPPSRSIHEIFLSTKNKCFSSPISSPFHRSFPAHEFSPLVIIFPFLPPEPQSGCLREGVIGACTPATAFVNPHPLFFAQETL